MCLPLVDGLFPALVLAGAVDGPLGILEVGLLVFGGSATVAVILADMDGGPREQVPVILGVGVVLIAGAAIEAALAPAIRSVIDLAIFQRFAALVILAVAAKTASARIGDLIPRPAVIVLLGLLASLQPADASLAVSTDLGLIARGAAAGIVGVSFAVAVSLSGPTLRSVVDLDRFRFGSAVALGTLALSVFGMVPSQAPLVVFGVAGLLAFDPEDLDAGAASPESGSSDGPGDDGLDDDLDPDSVPNVDDGPDKPTPAAAVTPDGGNDPDTETDEPAYGYPGEDGAEERAPWL
jgi:hypothetical protein